MTKSRFMLTPYFLDEYREGLHAAGEIASDCPINRLDLDPAAADIQHRVLPLYQKIKSFVQAAAEEDEIPVAMNGDCVMAIPVLAGLQAAGIDPLLLWFDAHGDFNNWETSPSGFLGGMPLAMMVGLGEQTIVEDMEARHLAPADVVLTDGRDLDPGEVDLVNRSNIIHLKTIEQLREIDLSQKPLWIHFDCDVLRLEDLPAVSYPAAGGPSTTELGAIFDHIYQTGQVVCVSVSLPNPNLDGDGRSMATTIKLTNILLGP